MGNYLYYVMLPVTPHSICKINSNRFARLLHIHEKQLQLFVYNSFFMFRMFVQPVYFPHQQWRRPAVSASSHICLVYLRQAFRMIRGRYIKFHLLHLIFHPRQSVHAISGQVGDATSRQFSNPLCFSFLLLLLISFLVLVKFRLIWYLSIYDHLSNISQCHVACSRAVYFHSENFSTVEDEM